MKTSARSRWDMTTVACPGGRPPAVMMVASGAFSTPAMARDGLLLVEIVLPVVVMPPNARATANTPQAAAMPQAPSGRPGHAAAPELTRVRGGCCRVRAAAAMTRSRSTWGARAARRAGRSRAVAS